MKKKQEEAERCIEAAHRCLRCGDVEKALQFLDWAQQRHPTQRAKGDGEPGGARGGGEVRERADLELGKESRARLGVGRG